MALNDIFEVAILMSVKGEKCCNVMHFRQVGADGPTPAVEECAGAVNEAVLPMYADCCSEDLTFVAVKSRKVLPAPGGFFFLPATTTVGTVTEDVTATQTNVALTLYSNEVSRKGRGMIHIPGVPDTFANFGRLVNSASGPYVVLGNVLIADIEMTGGTQFRAGILHKADGSFYPLTRHMLQSQLRTLRGRRMENPY